ncbi:MAG: hypothetical protein KKF89_01520 [Nanoarchaeota archaeon]|nr:hypothetical protein [Nanoarchaeota archaeon]MBU1854376.1 hypothetical protein [Nanoarchaeota archaeon]
MSIKKDSKIKKVSTKKKGLKKAAPEVCFYMVEGTCCSDLCELSVAIDSLSDELFKHHVNDEKNDFANWIEAVMEDKELADALRQSKDKNRQVVEILKVVVKNLK